ncbi:hypothetical protein D3C81_2012220 [compost metagenome]
MNRGDRDDSPNRSLSFSQPRSRVDVLLHVFHKHGRSRLLVGVGNDHFDGLRSVP